MSYKHSFKKQAENCPVLSSGVRIWRFLGEERRKTRNRREEEQEQSHWPYLGKDYFQWNIYPGGARKLGQCNFQPEEV